MWDSVAIEGGPEDEDQEAEEDQAVHDRRDRGRGRSSTCRSPFFSSSLIRSG